MNQREVAEWKSKKHNKPKSVLDKATSPRTSDPDTSPRRQGAMGSQGQRVPPVWPSKNSGSRAGVPRAKPTPPGRSQSPVALQGNLGHLAVNQYEVSDDSPVVSADNSPAFSRRRDSMEVSGAQGLFDNLGDTEKAIIEGDTDAMVSVAVATHPYVASNDRTISFVIGEVIRVIAPHSSGWWTGELRGLVKMFPVSRTELRDMPLSEYTSAARRSMVTPMFPEGAQDSGPVLPPMRRLTVSGEEGGLAQQQQSKAQRMLGIGEEELQGSPRREGSRSPRKERSNSLALAFKKFASPRNRSQSHSHAADAAPGARMLSPKAGSRGPIGSKKRETVGPIMSKKRGDTLTKKHSKSTNSLPNKNKNAAALPMERSNSGTAVAVASPRDSPRLVEVSPSKRAPPPQAEEPMEQQDQGSDDVNEDNLVY